MSKPTKYLNVDEFAKAIGKGRHAVIAMIKNGEIIAEDHRSPGSSIARYRIAATEEARWRQSRRTKGNQTFTPRSPAGQSGQTSVELFV